MLAMLTFFITKNIQHFLSGFLLQILNKPCKYKLSICRQKFELLTGFTAKKYKTAVIALDVVS
jgi:hypothetical protein